MNIRRGHSRTVAAGAAALAVAAGLGLGLTGTAGAATVKATPAKPATAAQQYVVPDCSGKPQVDPGTIVLACADYGLGLQGLHWTSEHRYTEATITYTAARPPVYVESGGKVVATYPISWTVPLAS